MLVSEQGHPGPFSFPRGPVACLLIHGFAASPAEMRPLGEYLAERGITVSAPLLPGHGTVPEDLRRVTWVDWVASAGAALMRLQRAHSTIFLCGLSMGAMVNFHLAAQQPVAGVIALSPAVRPRNKRFRWAHLLGSLQPWVVPDHEHDDLADPQNRALSWHYRRYPGWGAAQFANMVQAGRRALPRVQAPTLIVQSPRDGTLDAEGARWAYERIPAEDKTLVWLERSGHNIVIDVEREQIFEQVFTFIQQHRAEKAS